MAFNREVWSALLIMTALSAIALCITEYLGFRAHAFEGQNGWFDYSFTSVGIMALQGIYIYVYTCQYIYVA